MRSSNLGTWSRLCKKASSGRGPRNFVSTELGTDRLPLYTLALHQHSATPSPLCFVPRAVVVNFKTVYEVLGASGWIMDDLILKMMRKKCY